ncbi:hypothetical protein M404DRAFT_156320, partial [Pisolithus tinctorius Marx 270]
LHVSTFYSVHTQMLTGSNILEHKHARTVGALAAELCLPQLPNILHCFLSSQLFPTDDLDDIPLDECPLYDGSMHVYNSACSTFFALSNLCGLYGMCHKYIHSCPMWRNEGPCFDCVFVVTDPEAEGMHGLDIAHVLCFFHSSIKALCIHALSYIGSTTWGMAQM